MEKITAKEGEVTRFGAFSIAWACGRAGNIVAFVNSGECETADDAKREAARFRKKLDNKRSFIDNVAT